MSFASTKITGPDGSVNVVVVMDGVIYQTDNNHPNFDVIVEKMEAKDPTVVELFDLSKTLDEKFSALSERVSVSGGHIFFDGDRVEGALADHVLRLFQQGNVEDYAPVVRFWEKIASNPNKHSREQLFRWLQTHNITIAEDGDIVGYKGLRPDRTSVHAGPAVVDGKRVTGHVPNETGAVVTMARSNVTHDPGIGCHVGLHVGTWAYASSFGSVVVEVRVNPRDVVSVPTDCGDAKMRVCRYVVKDVVQGKYDDAVLYDSEDYDEYDEYDDYDY